MFPPSTYCFLGPYPPSNNNFPSSSSSYPYPSFTTFLNPENPSSNNNTFLHDPLSSVPYTIVPPTTTTTHNHAPINPETLTNWAVADHYAALLKQDLSSTSTGVVAHNYGNNNSSSISNFLNKKLPAKKPAKKDRHSKIHTSQGFRDRRVRLSIEIARKFFDLQDMLGFEKASNTLEWLLNKSKKDIEELTQISKHSSSAAAEDHNSFSYSSSEGDEVYSKDVMELDTQGQQQQQKVVDLDSEEKKMKRAQKEGAKMNESREIARVRARERTSGGEELKQKYPATENAHVFQQLMRPGGVDEESTGRDDIFNFIEESIVIKRKLKKSSVVSSSSNHQQNNNTTFIPNKEANFDNTDCQSSPMSPNWDANNNTAADDQPSNFCSISSMNLSAGLQIFGKSWEECSSPRRY